MSIAVLGLQVGRRADATTPPPSSFGVPPALVASVNYAGHPTIPENDFVVDVPRFNTELRTALGLPSGTNVLAGGHAYSTGWISTFQGTDLYTLYTSGPQFKVGMHNLKVGGETTWAGAANGSWDAALTTFVNSVPADFLLVLTIQHEPENDGVQPNADGGTWENQYGPAWSRMQARFATVVANLNRPNVYYSVTHMHITFPGHWAGTQPGVPGERGFNQRNPENWNPYQHMTAAVRARTIMTPDIYTKIEDLAATPTSWTGSTAVVSSTESPRLVTGEPVMVFQSDGVTPIWYQTFRAVSKVGSGTNPRTITFDPAFPSTPPAGSKLRLVELFADDYQAVIDYCRNAGWGVSHWGIGEHTINNDAFAIDAATTWLWANDVRPYLRSLMQQGLLTVYAHFNHSSGLASGDNGWVDLPGELVEFGAMAREINAGAGTGSGGTTDLAFRAGAQAGANSSTPAVTVPAAAQVGDYAVISFSCTATVTVTDPAGWTVLVSQDAGNVRTRVYGRFLTSGQPGAAVGPAMSTTSRWAMTCLTYSSVNTGTPMDAAPAVATSTTANAVQSTPAITTVTANATIVQIVTNRGTTSANTTAWTPPAGYVTRASSYPTGLPGASAAAADKAAVPPGTYGPDAWTSDASIGSFVGVTLALRPA